MNRKAERTRVTAVLRIRLVIGASCATVSDGDLIRTICQHIVGLVQESTGATTATTRKARATAATAADQQHIDDTVARDGNRAIVREGVDAVITVARPLGSLRNDLFERSNPITAPHNDNTLSALATGSITTAGDVGATTATTTAQAVGSITSGPRGVRHPSTGSCTATAVSTGHGSRLGRIRVIGKTAATATCIIEFLAGD